jgi:hypothetical protein
MASLFGGHHLDVQRVKTVDRPCPSIPCSECSGAGRSPCDLPDERVHPSERDEVEQTVRHEDGQRRPVRQ